MMGEAGVRAPVICLAHGSRNPASDASVVDIAAAVADLTGGIVRAAYLDFSPSTLTTVTRLLAAEGHREAIVVPLLFTTAFHMTTDVPEAIAEATAESGVELHLAGGVGTGEDVAELLAGRIAARHTAASLVLYSVGSSVAGANDTVAALAQDVGRRLGVPAHARVATGGPSTGPDALASCVEEAGAGGTVAVEPLFISPGRLWDLAVDRLREIDVPVSLGEPLGTAVAPLIVSRINAVIATQGEEGPR
ncbi:sirohydrochlorin chelatase [Corynebacterium sp. AOP40-9SA-29]|uniref:sirohydrochlorin chelatase n=1 Tax=Corynebacterium sp. AOP40-9SA-29 TaxID=3457677 RepID=UPI0040343848